MLVFGKYNGIADVTPFLAALSKAMAVFKEGAELFVTGEYAFSLVTGRLLPKITEIKSSLTSGEMIALCSIRGFEYTLRGDEVIIAVDEKRFIYSSFAGDTIETDARTRDFTMNAIYISVESGKAYDPCDALSDINGKRLVTATEASAVFCASPIRIMQMVRLACEYDYEVGEEMLAAAREYSSLLERANMDSVRAALNAILMSDTSKAYEGKDISGDNSPVLRGLLMLRHTDVFAAILPELEAGRGVEQKKRYHIYDVQEHMLHTSAYTPPRLYMRMAALLHDIGKPEAYKSNNGKNMHGHDRIGAGMARIALRRLRCKEDFINKVCRIIATHMYDIAGIAKVDTLRKRFAQWGYVLTQDIIDFRFSDVAGSGCAERNANSAIRFREIFEQMKSEGAPFSIYELKITGKEIARELDLHSGTEINDVKRELLRHCAIKPSDNENRKLMSLLHEFFPKEQ